MKTAVNHRGQLISAQFVMQQVSYVSFILSMVSVLIRKLRVHLYQSYLFFRLAPECAKKALHYGGICCYSCRAFFRRAHQNTKTPAFTCRTSSHGLHMGLSSPMSPNGEIIESGPESSKQCGYDVITKRQCQFHRLQRCLEIGCVKVLENQQNVTESFNS